MRGKIETHYPLQFLSLLSGVLLATIFPKANLWWVAWFALGPLLVALSQAKRGREAAWYGFLTGVPFYGTTFAFIFSLGLWVGNLIVLAWVLLVVFMSLYTALFGYLYHKYSGHDGSFMIAPVLWLLIEWLRALGPFGLVPSLGYSQWQALPLVQIASVVGVTGLSFILVLSSALLAELVTRKKIWAFCGWLFLIGIVVAYGYFQLEANDLIKEPGLTLVLVQANHAQVDKLDPRNLSKIKEDYLTLTKQCLQVKPDLVIWPETAIPFYLQNDPQYQGLLQQLAKDNKVNLILGLPRLDDKNRAYNSALFISSTGELLGWQDKHRLVPFGEYLPFRSLLMPLFSQIKELRYSIFMAQDFSQSQSVTPIQTPLGKIGLGICSDSFFPEIFTNFVDCQVDYLFIITNDTWFSRTSAYDKHLMVDVLRAVEFRQSLAQCANAGLSVYIDPRGRVIEKSQADQRELVYCLTQKVKSRSIYSQYGDWFTKLCLAGLVIYTFLKLRANRI